MVVRDLSYPDSSPNALLQSKALVKPIARIPDRFVALILDFLIFSPVVSFFVATTLRELKTQLLLDSQSDEAMVIWLFFIFAVVMVSVFVQSFFLYFWQATPGQMFIQLRVESYPQWMDGRKKLSYAQCLLRSVGWWGSWLFLGVPFLDILGHPLRRSIHERMSDTIVVSLKAETSDVPLPLETRYMSSTMRVFFGFVFAVVGILALKLYKMAEAGDFSHGKMVSQAYCQEIPLEKYQDQKRLDMAIALSIAELVEDECVYTEAQKVLWSSSEDQKALAQVAMSLIATDKKMAEKYQAKACESSPNSEACVITQYLSSQDSQRADLLRRAGLGLISSRLLLMLNSMESENYISAVALLHDLEAETLMAPYLEKMLVKAAWALNEKQAAQKNSRTPASNSEKEILGAFKERYEIP